MRFRNHYDAKNNTAHDLNHTILEKSFERTFGKSLKDTHCHRNNTTMKRHNIRTPKKLKEIIKQRTIDKIPKKQTDEKNLKCHYTLLIEGHGRQWKGMI